MIYMSRLFKDPLVGDGGMREIQLNELRNERVVGHSGVCNMLCGLPGTVGGMVKYRYVV